MSLIQGTRSYKYLHKGELIFQFTLFMHSKLAYHTFLRLSLTIVRNAWPLFDLLYFQFHFISMLLPIFYSRMEAILWHQYTKGLMLFGDCSLFCVWMYLRLSWKYNGSLWSDFNVPVGLLSFLTQISIAILIPISFWGGQTISKTMININKLSWRVLWHNEIIFAFIKAK